MPSAFFAFWVIEGYSHSEVSNDRHLAEKANDQHTLLSFELELKASPTFCVYDFSFWGWTVDAAESALPLSLSPKCSVVDFSESGCKHKRVNQLSSQIDATRRWSHTLSAAVALSERDWRPWSDMVMMRD